MELYLIYYPSFRDAAADDLLGIYETEELALKAIKESWYSETDKKDIYIVTHILNTRC